MYLASRNWLGSHSRELPGIRCAFYKNVSSNGFLTIVEAAALALDYRCDIHCRSVRRHASCPLSLFGYPQQSLPLPGAEIFSPRSRVIDQKYPGGRLGGLVSATVVMR